MKETTRFLFNIGNSLLIANKLVDVLGVNSNNTEITDKGYLIINNISDSIIRSGIDKLTTELENNSLIREIKTHTSSYKLTANSNVLGYLMGTLRSADYSININTIELDLNKDTLTAKYTIIKEDPVTKETLTALRNAVAFVEKEEYKSRLYLAFT